MVRKFHQEIIDARRETLQKNKTERSEENRDVLLDELLKADRKFSDKEILDHVITMLATGRIE